MDDVILPNTDNSEESEIQDSVGVVENLEENSRIENEEEDKSAIRKIS